MNDEQILDLYWARNEEAIACTDRVYGHRLQGLAYRILLRREDAEESVSDTYMRAWNTIPPRKPMHLFAYLARICRNLSLNKLEWKAAAKRRGEVVSITQEMEACIPDQRRDRETEARELGKLLDAFLRTLSEENQLVFLRRYWYADSITEIAARYGISESAVTMRLSRSREKLRDYLAKEGIRV